MNTHDAINMYAYAESLGEELYNTIKQASYGDPMAIAQLESLEEFNRLRKMAEATGAAPAGPPAPPAGAPAGGEMPPAPQATIVCPNCGSEVVPNPDGTCPNCGFNIVAGLQAMQQAGQANAAPQQAAGPTAAPVPEQQVAQKAASIMNAAMSDPNVLNVLMQQYGHLLG